MNAPVATDIKPTRDSIGITYLMLSGLGVVFLPVTAKLAMESGSDVYTVAFMRGIIATVILFAIVLALKIDLWLPRKLWLPSLVVGVFGALFIYGIVGAIVSINISLALLILYLYPMGVAIVEHFRGNTRLVAGQWICGLVVCAGLSLILGVKFEQISFIGVALASLAMAASVVITLVNVKIVETQGSLSANLHMSIWGVLIFGIALAISGEFYQPETNSGWFGLFGNGVAYCFAWVGFFAGARILGATRASMITLLEPAIAALVAWMIFDETFSTPQWFGFFVVLCALATFEILARANR